MGWWLGEISFSTDALFCLTVVLILTLWLLVGGGGRVVRICDVFAGFLFSRILEQAETDKNLP